MKSQSTVSLEQMVHTPTLWQKDAIRARGCAPIECRPQRFRRPSRRAPGQHATSPPQCRTWWKQSTSRQA
eukprot:6211375-Pleurochrysis_carterae.AAC.1